MTDIFESTARKYRGSPVQVFLFIAAFVMFVIGANHFVEDTVSSKIGLETLQTAYGLKVQIFQWTYWTMSIAPQVASIVFFYMFLSDTTRKGYFYLASISQLADFFADTWYRSDGKLFENGEVFIISSVLTFVFFSIGSEFFLSVGSGLILKMAAPALQTWKMAWTNTIKASSGNYRHDGDQKPPNGKGGAGGGENHERRTSDVMSKIRQSQQSRPQGGNMPLHRLSGTSGDENRRDRQ